MSWFGERNPESPSQEQGGPHPPLVIVSERGRHNEESRRIVRAQAARASAAQSRVTRARNRGEREGTTRESVQAPSAITTSAEEHQPPVGTDGGNQSAMPPLRPPGLDYQGSFGQLPLASWLPSILTGAAGAAVDRVSSLSSFPTTPFAGISNAFSPTSTLGFQQNSSSESVQSPSEAGKFQLPIALPKGFTALQQRIPISAAMVGLLSRTACVDFASPGVENRLHQLLFDLIIKGDVLALPMRSGHPIQGHLRIACTCLTIFQGQRANGQIFAQDYKYQVGLEAAWSEATLLNFGSLAESKSAEASLWALFIISVTTGATANFFQQTMRGLLQDLQLRYWEQVRRVLLDFIYPVSFLDEPCKHFYDSFRQVPIAAG